MVPGPTNVDPRVYLRLARPTLPHTSSKFAEILSETLSNLKQIFKTKGDVFAISGSGTLGMEMAIANVVQPGDKVLVVNGGFFGQRMAEIVRRHGGAAVTLDVPWGEAVDPKVVREKLAEDDYRALAAVHVETSTGVVNDIASLGRVAREFDVLFVVDAVCSLGGMDVRTDEWGIDVCFASSQKALASVPGMAVLAASERMIEYCQNRKTPVSFFYGDLLNWLKVMRDPSRNYFVTHSINSIYALSEATKIVLEEGLEKRFARHRAVARAVRESMKAIGLRMVPARKEIAADTVSAFYYPNGVDDALFRKHVEERYGVYIARGLGKLWRKAFRIGHLGNVSANDALATVGAVERTFADMGFVPNPGKAVSKAQEVLYKTYPS